MIATLSELWNNLHVLVMRTLEGFLAKVFFFGIGFLGELWVKTDPGNPWTEASKVVEHSISNSIFIVFVLYGFICYLIDCFYSIKNRIIQRNAETTRFSNSLTSDMSALPGSSAETFHRISQQLEGFTPGGEHR